MKIPARLLNEPQLVVGGGSHCHYCSMFNNISLSWGLTHPLLTPCHKKVGLRSPQPVMSHVSLLCSSYLYPLNQFPGRCYYYYFLSFMIERIWLASSHVMSIAAHPVYS